MSAGEFADELFRQGVKLWADGDQLRYRAPKGVMTSAYLAKLAEHKGELLRLLLQQRQESTPAVLLPQVVIAPTQRYLPFPTTDVQQAYWIGRSTTFALGSVGNHSYIEVDALDLDLARSLLILRRLIERHPMLRAIMLPDGQQQILEHVPPFQITTLDLEGLDQQDANAQLMRIRQEMDHQVFQVEQWPAFEIRVSRLHARHVRVHLSIEALFIDAWSIRILIQEFLHLYHEPEAYLPPLELSFRDYILAEAKLQQTALYQRSHNYWLERIQDLPPAPDLPLVADAASLKRPRFECRKACMQDIRWQQLKARGARMGLTPSGILLAAFAEVLTIWSKTPRFCINLTIFNRLPLHEQVNDIVGDFTTLLLLAVNNSIPSTFVNRARRLQEQLLHDFDHRHYSGIRVMRDLARVQGGSTPVLMPVVFTSVLGQETATTYPVPWQETVYYVTQTPQVSLDHQVMEEAGNLVLYWQAIEALFPQGLLDEMFETYIRFLHQLATDEEIWQRSSCDLVPSSQLTQRAKINATQAPISDRLLQSFFVEQATKRPHHVAVISPRRTLLYQEVLREATLLGHQLRQRGVRPNQLVGVVMEKGWEQVVGVLGVLLSGAAYLPIDPKLPQERLTFLLEHGEIQQVITQSWIEKTVQWPKQITRLCVDEQDVVRTDVEPLDTRQKPDDLAYMIYTSGSTGLPKGVMIDHRGAVNTLVEINHRFGVTSEDRVLALSALNFDLSVYDIFGLFAAGGTIVIPAEDALRNPAAWLDILVQERVTLWNSVPALLEMLVDYSETHPEALSASHLRLVLLSGDWIAVSLPDRVRKLIAGIEIISLGGATEASIWSILYPISVVEPSWKSIPYGQPLRNQRIFVLNEQLEPCPVWVPGYLYIGGIGLAKGYWRDEEKTRASFFPHPQTGERFYRTGDLGRYLPDGNIEFLGREDFQVKVQGHRIELGEIEETLLHHPAVRTAVATALTQSHGDKRLVAYVVLQSEQAASSNGSHLPYYIVDDVASEKPRHKHLEEQTYSDEQENSSHAPLPHKRKNLYKTAQYLALQFGQTSIRKEIARPVIELAGTIANADLLKTYRERLSYRTFLQEPIPFRQLSDFLGTLRQIELEGLPKYLYPSAGGVYPVQTYVAMKPHRVEGVPEGIYYYNPQVSQLVMLSDTIHLKRSLYDTINQPIFDQAAFSLFLIGDLLTISTLYGETARDFCLLEAGYMSQLLMMRAAEHQIGLCPVGDLDFEPVRDVFALGEHSLLLHSLLCGRVDPKVATGWTFLLGNNTQPASQPQVEQSAPVNAVTTTELHSFLKEKLPAYMVPSAIMIVKSLPLTPQGKVDRQHLPMPEPQSSGRETAYVAPTSKIEQTIAAVWQEVLATEKVGIHDNFFDLGGNSLLMVRAYAKLRQILTHDMSVIEMFFQYPSIHTLATFLAQGQHVQPALEENPAQLYRRLDSRKSVVQQQRQVRLRHRTTERNTEDV